MVDQRKLFEDEQVTEEPKIEHAIPIPITPEPEDEGDSEHYCDDCKKNFKFSSNDLRPFIYCNCKKGYRNPNLKNTKN